MDKIYLVLENGEVFEGESFGAKHEVIGQLVFNTSTVGYLQTLTDKGYYGQVLIQTFPTFGNYGVNDDVKGKTSDVKAVLCREVCDKPSNFRSEGKVADLLKEWNVVGVAGLDTRRLAKTVRTCGHLNVMITENPNLTEDQRKALKEYKIENAMQEIAKEFKGIETFGEGTKVCLINLGETYDIVDQLVKRGCQVTVLPHNASAKEILSMNPKAVVYSSGSDNTVDISEQIKAIKELAKEDIYFLGIGFGHQVLAASQNCELERMTYGHHGNQPVKDLATGKLFSTYTNHNFRVSKFDDKDAVETLINVNDRTNEGLEYKNIKGMSVQFIPTDNGGLNMSSYIYDEFISKLKENK